MSLVRKAAVIATGWIGDTLACSAAAISLSQERGFDVDFYIKWPQLLHLLGYDTRFKTHCYKDSRFGCYKLWKQLRGYNLIIHEPTPWSYQEPFTAEIRRLAGCEPKSSLRMMALNNILSSKLHSTSSQKRLVVSRDLYKRAYGRDVDALMLMLGQQYDVQWVGLDPAQSSKKGKKSDLFDDACIMCSADCFLGPEGGLLWLAGVLGVKTVYFTENIEHISQTVKHGDPHIALGNINVFPNEGHTALPAYCRNAEVLTILQQVLYAE